MLSAQVLRISLALDNAGSFVSNTVIAVKFSNFILPALAQPAMTSVSAGTTSDGVAILDSSVNGTFPAIYGTLVGPVITLGSQIKGATTTATVTFTPATLIVSGANAGISVTLFGSRVSLGSASTCFVNSVSCLVSCISGNNSILTVKLTSLSYVPSVSVSIVVAQFVNPNSVQSESVNVAAGTSNDFSAVPVVINDISVAGTFPAIFDTAKPQSSTGISAALSAIPCSLTQVIVVIIFCIFS
jgi:hypothetical protein